ncbi:MAG TPA: hypothetical protein VJ779_07015 [Acetobacteraceae bacterium]|nr:hypothetical protein [Acetobacteraceae bacterium]
MNKTALPAPHALTMLADLGLPPPVPAEVADTGRIRFGAGVRLPAPRPSA